MEIRIFHGVNNALYFLHGNTTVITDGIHQGRSEGFSNMHPAMMDDLLNHRGIFHAPDLILFTHLHPDHFDLPLLQHSLETQPKPLVYGPCLNLSSLTPQPLGGGVFRLPFEKGALYAQDTVHEGEEFRNDPHQVYLMELAGERFFLAGDAVLQAKDALRMRSLAGGSISAAFFNIYQLWEPGGTDFIRNLKPERVFINHMPFPEDDQSNLYGLARQVIRRFPPDIPAPVLIRPMNWVDQA